MVMIATVAEFEAAHRQYGDDSKCGKLHGHNWKVDIIVDGDNVNQIGYLINFSELKRLVSGLDHSVILCREDPLIPILQAAEQKIVALTANPSCENLARIICESVPTSGLKFIGVTVWENNDSRATATWTPEKGIS